MKIGIILYLLLISNLIRGQNGDVLTYKSELKIFLNDIFSDSSHYTYNDFKRDSILKLKLENYSSKSDFNEAFNSFKRKIDTVDSKYMIRTDGYKIHFDSLFLLEKFMDYWNENDLKSYLLHDTIFNTDDSDKIGYLIPNRLGKIQNSSIENKYPIFFTNQSVEESVNSYKFCKDKIKLSQDIFDAIYITRHYMDSLNLNRRLIQKKSRVAVFPVNYISMTLPLFDLNCRFAYFIWSYGSDPYHSKTYECYYKKKKGKWTVITMLVYLYI